MLLVPEGALVLNGCAIAAVELVDGNRTVDDIVARIVEEFEVDEPRARSDVGELLGRLSERGFVV
jgi:hypothetical protein